VLVVGTSGLTAAARRSGVLAAGNFSLTAALAKHFSAPAVRGGQRLGKRREAGRAQRHDAGPGAEPYVNGTLLAVRRVMEVISLARGLDRLLFGI
jgi:hypothetical protein